ncbi:MAG TPA: FAD-dependent thymidylate synthase [Acidobacteriota bacterium]|nr:FAD-dependent thymidylate synthase [Acidobacteriota bacterium]
MKIVLAGYNVDSEVIGELKRSSPPRADVTPETLSAAYARISRDPRPADELRAAARAEVERARRSNRNIIFGMGHHSVAEHAVFNFDVIGVSRLAIEDLERFRLCSFTEKSQRYIKLGEDFVVPAEIREAGMESFFASAVRRQNALYHRLYERLRPHFFERNSDAAKDPRNHSVLDGWAKEDARYIVSLAAEGQLGMTVNARNLELLIRRFASKPLAELREIGSRLYALAGEIAPSIILFTEGAEFDAETVRDIGSAFGGSATAGRSRKAGKGRPPRPVRLLQSTPDADDRLLAALAYVTSGDPYDACLARVRAMTAPAKKRVAKAAFRRMEFYDFPLREFEFPDLTFELVVSASCYAQLKRHRMATLTAQPYDPGLGVTVPPSIAEIGAVDEFSQVVAATDDAHARLAKAVGRAADYVLTNAHRRRVLLKLNARELYHVSRLREDASAQWDIRRLVGGMSALARKAMPLTCLMLGGKDAYPGTYRKVFGRPPVMTPPAMFK